MDKMFDMGGINWKIDFFIGNHHMIWMLAIWHLCKLSLNFILCLSLAACLYKNSLLNIMCDNLWCPKCSLNCGVFCLSTIF